MRRLVLLLILAAAPAAAQYKLWDFSAGQCALPQGATCTRVEEGYVCWDTDDNRLYVGTSSAAALVCMDGGTCSASGLVCTDCVALGSETTGSYAAGDAEAGNALTGDTATAFFSAGAVEAARGGTGTSTAASTGVARVDSGAWTVAELSGDVATSGSNATVVQANAVALTTDTTGNYAAGDAEAGAALTGDSATAFFSAGTVEVARGGTGAAPGADDQLLVSDSTSAATWRGVGDCVDSGGNHLNYTASSNSFSCGTSGGAVTVRWDQLAAPTAAVALTSDGTSETFVEDYQAAFAAATVQHRVKQTTGNPTGGTLVQIDAADADVTPLAVYGTGTTNGVTVDRTGLLAKAGSGSVQADDVVCASCVATGDVDGTLTAANLAAALTFSDGDLVDLSAINDSATTEGLRLPQSATAGSQTLDGAVHWDSTADKLYVGDGAAAGQVDGQPTTMAFGSAVAGTSTSTTYTTGSQTVFPGSSSYHGTLTHSGKANVWVSTGSATCTLRIQDLTNSLTLCSATTTSTSSTNILDCGTFSNVPSAAAIVAVQLNRASGTGTCSIFGGFWTIE